MQQGVAPPGLVAGGLAPPGTKLPFPTIDLNLRFISPVSSAVGSPTLHFNQKITATQLPNAGFWLLVVNTIIQIVVWLCGEDKIIQPDPAAFPGSEQMISMSLPQLAQFLAQLGGGNWDLPQRNSAALNSGDGITRPGVQVLSPAYLTLFLLVNATPTGRAGTPIFSLFVPLLSFVGISGGLPIIIMGLISTILVRHVVPPSSSGTAPMPDPPGLAQPSIELKLQELMQLLKGWGQLFDK
ncbi:MAG: hypothetical protein M0Z55_06885 [Peptococcaceae bacterium]|nr:hypothetical protein [Peptococcaceae bacterium]